MITNSEAKISELRDLLSWLGKPPRSPLQTNEIHQSDSEILRLGNDTFLATTIDSISEEIDIGLYRDPYTMGWVVAMASLSDLAAVGADPLGMLFSAEWGRGSDFSLETKARVSQGFSDALRTCGTYLLGGDTGRSRSTLLSGVALGLCDSQPLSRVGMKEGDWVCITGKCGNGPALALKFLRQDPDSSFSESLYRPIARIPAGIALRPISSAAMDTSDGIITTLDTLRHLNGVQFELYWSPETLSDSAREYLDSNHLPHFLLWANEHGDYQLITTIPPERIREAEKLVPDLYRIGRVTRTAQTTLISKKGQQTPLNFTLLRQLIRQDQTDFRSSLAELIAYSKFLEIS